MPLHESARPLKPNQVELRNEFLAAPPEAILSRRVVAAGLNRSIGWLELRATKGDGPPYLKVGNFRVSYVKRDVIGWWSNYATRITSTSDIKASRGTR